MPLPEKLLSLSSIALLLIAAAACGSNDSALGALEGDQKVDPKGSDNPPLPGSLVVTAPSNVQYNPAPSVWIDGAPAELGKARELPAGGHGVHVRNTLEIPEWNFGRGFGAGVGLAVLAATTTTVKLGALRFSKQKTGLLFGVDVQPSLLRGANVPGKLVAYESQDERITPLFIDTPASIVARPARAYHYRVGLFDGFDVRVESDQVTTVDLDARDGRRLLQIIAPRRELPSVCSSYEVVAARGEPTETRTSGPFEIPSAATLTFGEQAIPGVKPATYTLTISDGSRNPQRPKQVLPLTAASPGEAPAVFEIGRIDVDDVLVTRPDGSTSIVHGTYTIEQLVTENGVEKAIDTGCSSGTKTGRDLLPGKYRVRVFYPTVEAGVKEDVHVLTIP